MSAVRATRVPEVLVWALAAAAAGAAGALVATGAFGNAPSIVFGLAALAALFVVLARDLRVGLVFMLVALPLDTAGRVLASPVTVTVFHMTLLATLAVWGGRLLLGQQTYRPRLSAVGVGFLALVAAAIWSYPQSLDQGATLMAIVRLVFLFTFYLACETLISDRVIARIVVATVVGTAALSSALAVVQYRFPDIAPGMVHTQIGAAGAVLVRPAGLFSDPNYLGTFASIAILAALAKALHARRVRGALPWLLGAAVCSAGLLVTYSRTAWVGVAAGLVVLLLSAPKRRIPALVAMTGIAVVLILVAAPAQVVSRFESITDFRGDGSIATRYLMVGSTVHMIEDRWALGTGLGAYDAAYPPYRLAGSNKDIFEPHELPLAMWAEMGIPGLIAELLLIVGVVVELRRRHHKGWNVYEAAGVAGLLALLVQSFFQYYLYFEYLWLFFALTVAAARFDASSEEVSA